MYKGKIDVLDASIRGIGLTILFFNQEKPCELIPLVGLKFINLRK